MAATAPRPATSNRRFARLPQATCDHSDQYVKCDLPATWGCWDGTFLVAVLCAWHRGVWERADRDARRRGIIEDVEVSA